MQDFLGGGCEAEFLVLVIGGGVKEKRTLRGGRGGCGSLEVQLERANDDRA